MSNRSRCLVILLCRDVSRLVLRVNIGLILVSLWVVFLLLLSASYRLHNLMIGCNRVRCPLMSWVPVGLVRKVGLVSVVLSLRNLLMRRVICLNIHPGADPLKCPLNPVMWLLALRTPRPLAQKGRYPPYMLVRTALSPVASWAANRPLYEYAMAALMHLGRTLGPTTSSRRLWAVENV